ncbi:hypothetical protein BDU57DRAFT_452279 [Ampelomyces quisqualis]|uniref:TM7S3/TM198-like domain-containing protein n=1 Tax=Ampelomyces quisqualis TaxID=50730 RepID=A0A6A5QLF3_AMPQU|nr:hypothetical protein BDU57DRAFT_452279 [Ampelomyces quisqualis]
MHTFRFILLCLALVLCLHSVAAVPHHAVRRQDDDRQEQSQASLSAPLPSSRPSSTVAPSGTSQSLRSTQASSTNDSKKPSGTAPTSVMQVPATNIPEPDSAPSAEHDPESALPIHPKVTPAMGLAGTFLLITGIVYAVIGIKNKWIYVFSSAAYLTALAVTVLIVYLMNPPVSNGIQAAFFVAAFVTGIIFGVLSLVFSDITEGFGCLLGGFCLSMWFLSLRSGGLIHSSTGRAIFIGCMSAGGYSLSFSHYTRNYGLIASISFSGATATILGVDCLARAGWKEFWLYLWSLNDDIFPLNTSTYPLTKNIKAELAGVVIIAVFGVISQLRVWNMVKERREKNAAQQLEQQQEKERQEEERGRTVEDVFKKEREQWEAAYGNTNIPETSVRSSTIASLKDSKSIHEKETYGMGNVETAKLPKSGDAATGPTMDASVLGDDDIQQIDAQGNPIPYQSASSDHGVATADGSVSDRPETTPAPNRASVTKRFSVAVPPPPPVVPLPFTVPNEEDTRNDDSDNASVSAVADSHCEAAAGRRPMSKRNSDMSATRQFPMNRASRFLSESSETLANPEEDGASSIAATLDNDYDKISLRQNSLPPSPVDDEHKTTEQLPVPESEPTGAPAESQDEEGEPAAIQATLGQPQTTSRDSKVDQPKTKRISRGDSQVRADTVVGGGSVGEAEHQTSSRSDAHSQGSRAGRATSHVGSLMDGVLPARLSKVALSYRTNEWAKHLEAAEKPDLDDLAVSAASSVILEEVPEEKAAPVSDEIAGPLLVDKRASRRVSVDRSASTLPDSLVAEPAMTQVPGVVSRAASSRSSSVVQPDPFAPLPSNTLLGKRDTLMRKRTSSQPFTPGSSASNLLEQADQESMSLAQRREMLQHHQATTAKARQRISVSPQRQGPPLTSQKWQSKGWATKGAPTGFDSHQPKRMSSSQTEQKREELYAGWRNSMRDVAGGQTQAKVVEQQRAALINERRQREADKQKRESRQQQRASQMDSMMRSGHMLEAHREAMRKMQANANKKVG